MPSAAGGVPADAAGVVHPPAGGDIRIVSLVPSITELLFDLGLGDHVVGRTRFCVHPHPAVDALPSVGGTKTVDMRRLRALAPSHVIVNVEENLREQAEEMAGFVPHVIVTYPRGPDDNPTLYRLLGAIFSCRPRAEALCRHYACARGELLARTAGLPRRRVLYLIWRRPWMTISADTYIARTLALAGLFAVPMASERRYPEVELDDGLLARTDLLLLSSEPYPFKEEHVKALRQVAGPAGVDVCLVDAQMTSWYGSRALRGLRYLGDFARMLAGRACSTASS